MARFLASLLVAVMVVAPCAIAMPTVAYANALVAGTDAHHAAAADHEAAPCDEPAHGADSHCGASCQNWSALQSVPAQLQKSSHSVGADWAVAPGRSTVWYLTADGPQAVAKPPDTGTCRASNFSTVFARTGRLRL